MLILITFQWNFLFNMALNYTNNIIYLQDMKCKPLNSSVETNWTTLNFSEKSSFKNGIEFILIYF